jgi:hypothetical protein
MAKKTSVRLVFRLVEVSRRRSSPCLACFLTFCQVETRAYSVPYTSSSGNVAFDSVAILGFDFQRRFQSYLSLTCAVCDVLLRRQEQSRRDSQRRLSIIVCNCTFRFICAKCSVFSVVTTFGSVVAFHRFRCFGPMACRGLYWLNLRCVFDVAKNCVAMPGVGFPALCHM